MSELQGRPARCNRGRLLLLSSSVDLLRWLRGRWVPVGLASEEVEGASSIKQPLHRSTALRQDSLAVTDALFQMGWSEGSSTATTVETVPIVYVPVHAHAKSSHYN
jgi:hypothetical protein